MKVYWLLAAWLMCACCFARADDETGSTLSRSEADEVVAEHNRAREEAGVVVEIAWDADLARHAQEWADELARTGVLSHRPENPYGENIAMASVEPFTAIDAFLLWEAEEEAYNGEAIDLENSIHYGHYTQMIWDRTTLVGCGRAVSATGEVYVVCNYSPAGNVIGERPITVEEEEQEGGAESP